MEIMWRFCLNSLFRSYGRGSLRHIGGPHPVKAAAGFRAGAALDLSGDPPYIVPPDRGQEEPPAIGPETVIGLHAWLFPYDRGDCADFPTWLLADQGIKREQTGLRPPDLARILGLLESVESPAEPIRTMNEANLYVPAHPDRPHGKRRPGTLGTIR
jgi:hypothetical protein